MPTIYKIPEIKVHILRECEVENPQLDAPDKAAAFWREHIASDPRMDLDTETLVALHMNTRLRIKGFTIVSQGILDTILCHPREVFKAAIARCASSIVLMHNHPSGDPSPSDADIRVTKQMVEAGKLLKVNVTDHIIMGEQHHSRIKDYVSLRELGFII